MEVCGPHYRNPAADTAAVHVRITDTNGGVQTLGVDLVFVAVEAAPDAGVVHRSSTTTYREMSLWC